MVVARDFAGTTRQVTTRELESAESKAGRYEEDRTAYPLISAPQRAN
jgi:hypothetical protein